MAVNPYQAFTTDPLLRAIEDIPAVIVPTPFKTSRNLPGTKFANFTAVFELLTAEAVPLYDYVGSVLNKTFASKDEK